MNLIHPLFRIASLLAMLATPAGVQAMGFSVEGNKSVSPANYDRWPGLADLVNLDSRQRLIWVNGDEALYYTGGADELNAALLAFSKIEADSRHVVFRPGPFKNSSLDQPEKQFDWRLHILNGISRGYVERQDLKLVSDMDPVLTVYVTDRIDLDKVVIPNGVKAATTSYLLSRYTIGLEYGNDETKKRAEGLLKSLQDKQLREADLAGYGLQLRKIFAFTSKLPTEHRVVMPMPPSKPSRTLKAAVDEFNEKAARDEVGKTQPPLTEAEVVAAIRGWIRDNTPASDVVFEQYQQIAETGMLPEGVELDFMTGWHGYRGYNFTVWWINLEIKLDKKQTGMHGYNFRIRDQKISSRPLTPEELERSREAEEAFQRQTKKHNTEKFFDSLSDESNEAN